MEHPDTFLQEIIDTAQSRNCSLRSRIEAWIDALDRIGMAIGEKDSETSRFTLNKVAQRDIGVTAAVEDLNLKEREVVIEDERLIVWKPKHGNNVEHLGLLTKREQETLGWTQKGKTSGEVAILMGISKRTVEKHRENIRKKQASAQALSNHAIS